MKQQNDYHISLRYYIDYEKFYNTYKESELDFTLIDNSNLERLREEAINLDNEVSSKLTVIKNNCYIEHGYYEKVRLARIMTRLILNPQRYNANNKTEGMLLYILCVDPNFLAISLFNTYKDDMDTLKRKLEKQFGVYDDNIVNIIMNENKLLQTIDPMIKKQIKLESSKELKKVLDK